MEPPRRTTREGEPIDRVQRREQRPARQPVHAPRSRDNATYRGPGQNTPPAAPPKEGWLTARTRIRGVHVAVLVAVLVAFIALLIVQNSQIQRLKDEVRETSARAAEMLQTLAEKERELAFSQTDAFIEQEARKRFGYIYEGEHRFLPEGNMEGGAGE